MSEYISRSELAKRLNVSRAAVTQAIKNGRIKSLSEDGKSVHRTDGLREFIQTGRKSIAIPKAEEPEVRAAVAAGIAAMSWGTVEEEPATNQEEIQSEYMPEADQNGAIPGMAISRERREYYQAELARLEMGAKRGELVSAEAVKKEAFNLAKTVREALVNIPDRLANQLAAESDPATIHMALSQELVLALERLANA